MNALDVQGQSSLHRAAKHGNVNVCRLLLQYGADASLISLQGHTAAQLAPENIQKILKGL